MKLSIKNAKLSEWLKIYAEIVIYCALIAGGITWEIFLWINLSWLYHDIIIASIGLQILNMLLALVVAKKMRLLAQLLLISAILFAIITIYYLKVSILNVV